MGTNIESLHRSLVLNHFSHIKLINDQLDYIEYATNVAMRLRNFKDNNNYLMSEDQQIDIENLIVSLGKVAEKESDLLKDFKLA